MITSFKRSSFLNRTNQPIWNLKPVLASPVATLIEAVFDTCPSFFCICFSFLREKKTKIKCCYCMQCCICKTLYKLPQLQSRNNAEELFQASREVREEGTILLTLLLVKISNSYWTAWWNWLYIYVAIEMINKNPWIPICFKGTASKWNDPLL